MKRFFSRWFVRAVLIVVLVSIFFVQGWLGALMGWLVFAYLLWRALPGVRRDFRRVWRGVPAASKGLARF